MSFATLAIVAAVTLVVLVSVLRTMAIVRHADENSEHHWRALSHLQSESGVAFFPTAEARLELEVVLKETLELAPV
jgi:hypothetical protein